MARRPFERDEHRYRDAQRGQPGERGDWSERGGRGGWGGGGRGWGGAERDRQSGFAERLRDEDLGADDEYRRSRDYDFATDRGGYGFARDYPRFGQARRDAGDEGRAGANWRRGQNAMDDLGETGSNDRGGFGDSEYAGSQGRYAGRSGGFSNDRSEYGGGQSDYGRQQRGQYVGRGPRGYQRSDERIREEVCEMLTIDPDIDASDVEIQVNGGQIVLTGTVEDREQKRAAEDVAESVSGVKEVRNELRLKSRELGRDRGEQHASGAAGGQQTAGRGRESASGGAAQKTR